MPDSMAQAGGRRAGQAAAFGLSVVVPTYNRAETLRRTLAALLEQNLDGHQVEIVVADDGSQDDTAQVVASLAGGDNPALRHLRLPHGGLGATLNRGILAARAGLVLLLDDDILIEPGVVRGHIEEHARQADRRVLLGGDIVFDQAASLLEAAFSRHLPGPPNRRPRPVNWLYFSQAHMSFRKEFVTQAGMFFTEMKAFQDISFNHRMFRQGARFVFAPALRGLHLCPTLAGSDFLGKAALHGQAMALWQEKSEGVLEDIQALGRVAADFGLPVIHDSAWQILKDRLDRLLVNRATAKPLLAAARALEHRCRPLAVRLFRRVYRHNLRQTYLEARRNLGAPPSPVSAEMS